MASSTRRRLVATTVAAMAGALTLSGFTMSANAFRAEPTVGLCNVAQNTGYLVNGYADILDVRNGDLLAVDGGGSSLSSRLQFVDLSGLANKPIARFWQDDDMTGLRDYVFDDVRPTFIRLFSGWDHLGRVALTDDPRLDRDYVLLWTARPGGGGGDWVRSDAVPGPAALDAARQWGRDSINLIDDRYEGVTPPVWWCGDVVRPTPPGAGTPAPLPLTRFDG